MSTPPAVTVPAEWLAAVDAMAITNAELTADAAVLLRRLLADHRRRAFLPGPAVWQIIAWLTAHDTTGHCGRGGGVA